MSRPNSVNPAILTQETSRRFGRRPLTPPTLGADCLGATPSSYGRHPRESIEALARRLIETRLYLWIIDDLITV